MSNSLLNLVDLVLTALTLAIIARALLSWFDPAFRSSFGRLIHDLTEPIVGPIRRVMPPFGMFDLSTIVAIVLIQVLERLLNQTFR
jgi:YggT family protein